VDWKSFIVGFIAAYVFMWLWRKFAGSKTAPSGG
jgi:multisubunit Na+/H+ antiporter MnhE subunit